MKCISILQPRASLCVTTDPKTGKAYKQIETRSWNTKFRGPLLIHASKAWKPEQEKLLDNPFFGTSLQDDRGKIKLKTGAIIGMVNLVDTMNTERIILPPNESKYRSIIADPWKITDQELAFGDYSEKRFGWLFSDPVLFKNPIPCKGSLSIWNLPGELEEAVQEQIRMATAPSVLLATPGEGAVIVDGVKNHSCGTCKHDEKEVTQFPCDRCTPVIYDCWEQKEPLTLPANSTDMLMDALRKSEIY